MSSEETFEVHFGRPMALFSLPGVTVMPHGLRSLHFHEPRYVEMIEDALEGNKQFATATFEGRRWMQEYHSRPPVRPVVCIVQIMQHARLDDGTFYAVIQGICRARIVDELPADEERTYRLARLAPVEYVEPNEELLEPFRQRILTAMSTNRLGDLRGAQGLLHHLRNPSVPSSAIFEVLGYTYLTDEEVRYRLLASDDARERALIVSQELLSMQRMLERAQPQRASDAPKGCHWN